MIYGCQGQRYRGQSYSDSGVIDVPGFVIRMIQTRTGNRWESLHPGIRRPDKGIRETSTNPPPSELPTTAPVTCSKSLMLLAALEKYKLDGKPRSRMMLVFRKAWSQIRGAFPTTSSALLMPNATLAPPPRSPRSRV